MTFETTTADRYAVTRTLAGFDVIDTNLELDEDGEIRSEATVASFDDAWPAFDECDRLNLRGR